MFSWMKRRSECAQVMAFLPTGTPPVIGRQMVALSHKTGIPLSSPGNAAAAHAIALLGTRVGIDFQKDPAAPAKFLVCIYALKRCQENNINPADPVVLDAMSVALRTIG